MRLASLLLAGLLAAAVLAEAYDHVTLVERDELPGDDEPRRGVPQGRHAHVLLPRGADALDELFPGFLDELTADGGASASRLSQRIGARRRPSKLPQYLLGSVSVGLAARLAVAGRQ